MSGTHSEEKEVYSVALARELSERLVAFCDRSGFSPEVLIELALKRLFRKEGAGGAVYISAPFESMMKGLYEEMTTIGEVKRHGDFGIGTFNDLDGELVLLDGGAYQLRPDSSAVEVEDGAKTPFACVTFFNPISVEELDRELGAAAFEDLLERLIPSPNLFYAVRIEGSFSHMSLWSVPRQPAGRPISEVRLAAFELPEAEGTIAGFYSPRFVKPLNKPGFHLHFLNADRTRGGHLRQCALKHAKIGVQLITRLELDLPTTLDFLTVEML